MTDDNLPSNPYAAEAATAPRLQDREGYPAKAQRSAYGDDLSDEAQLGTPCAACGRLIAPGEAVSDRRGGPWHRLCAPSPEAQASPAAPPAASTAPQPPTLVHIVRGHIKFIDPVRGFGFIARNDGAADVFLHREALRASGFTTFVPGSGCGIEVEAVERKGSLTAIRVRWLEWHP